MKIQDIVASVTVAALLPIGTASAHERVTVTASHAALAPQKTVAVPSPIKASASTKASFTSVAPNSGAGARLFRDPEASKEMADSYREAKEGDAAAEKGAWQEAEVDYRQALALVPENRQAIYGMAACAGAAGDTATQIKYYRAAIYSSDPSRYGTVPGDGYQENDVSRLMEYALLLNKTGPAREAVSVYNRAAHLLDFDPANGHLRELVVLPQFGDSNDQEAYAPRKLAAMARLAIGVEVDGHEGYGTSESIHDFQEAMKLAPDSAEAHFYLGKYLYGKNDPGAKAELQKAVELGDGQTAAAANEFVKLIH